jgi:transcription elongation GreA/GreB family factor
MNKSALLNAIIEILQNEESSIISAALTAKTAATEVEAKPENKYDTRGLEQSYLAAGQARRAAELKNTIIHFKNLIPAIYEKSDAIDLTALVDIESDDGEIKTYFILPERGGIPIHFENREIHTLSFDSPLGQVLMGKTSGDFFELKSKGLNRSFIIKNIY